VHFWVPIFIPKEVMVVFTTDKEGWEFVSLTIHITLNQGRRKRSGWFGLGRTNFWSLVGVVICNRLILMGVVVCYRPARHAHQCSVQIRSSCRMSNSCNKQVSESSNTRLKLRLEGKQRSINHHHHHGYKCWRYCRSYEAQSATY